ncbi:MAG: tellurite resistance/C4-dicarboxylate transporter family protein [Gammaproteobacteria bacterium]|nr:tellurite resistance/C4-dicarboxylate transporter family protein [Gammaproteobacteria bacterium]
MQPPPRAQASALAHLSPAYFSMVMATGIVSIGAWRLGLPILAQALFALNAVFFVLLWTLYVIRFLRYRQRVVADFCSHDKGAGFFTVVAATGILGSQCLLLLDHATAALALWALAVLLWLALTFSIFAILTVKESKPTLARGINGGWLLAVVATQAIAALSALLATEVGHEFQLPLNFIALSMWLWGGMLYIWMMSLIFFRYTFFVLRPDDLSPPYWINMGAMAISTLVGALLSINVAHATILDALEPFIKGFTIFYWATGTWWIPMLLVLGFWRHVYKRYPLRFEPLFWGAVFPLGMYAVATHEMSAALGFHFLDLWTWAMFAAGLAAWALMFVGQLHALAGYRRGSRMH